MAMRNVGNQTLGSSNVQFPPANNKAVCRFQNTSGAALALTTFYGFWAASGSAKVKAVIYSDSAGSPNTLLATSNELVGIASGWNSLTFPTPLSVANNAYVWIGVISDTAANSVYCLASGEIKYNANTYSSGPSSTFGSSSSASFTYPMFVLGDDGSLAFGRASIDSVPGNYQPDREHGDKFTLGGSSSVSVSSISTYVNTTSATVKSKAAIYTNSGGLPGALIAQTVEVVGSTANSWLTLNFSSPPTLTPGDYWLCFIADTNLVTPTIPVSGNIVVDGLVTEAGAWPSTITFSASVAPVGIDIYASYSLVIPSTGRPQVCVCT